MTRNEAKLRVQASLANIIGEQFLPLILEDVDKFYNDFEQDLAIATRDKTCDGCIDKPLPKGNYPETCETCSRFYADNYEEKRKCK